MACAAVGTLASAHGDVTPQSVDTSSLPQLGADWRPENLARIVETYEGLLSRWDWPNWVLGNHDQPRLASRLGEPQARKIAAKKAACVKEIDDYYATSVRRGKTRNGAVYMPPFEGILSQEAVWSIKAYLETRREKPL